MKMYHHQLDNIEHFMLILRKKLFDFHNDWCQVFCIETNNDMSKLVQTDSACSFWLHSTTSLVYAFNDGNTFIHIIISIDQTFTFCPVVHIVSFLKKKKKKQRH